MSELSEEKIIKRLKDAISLFNGDTHCFTYSDNERVEAIQGLLDLSQKEKQKNKELEEENQKLESSNDYLSNLNHKYYEDNVTLLRKNGKVDILADGIHFKYIDDVNNYIPKLKVRELREIDNIDLLLFKIKELLEERN